MSGEAPHGGASPLTLCSERLLGLLVSLDVSGAWFLGREPSSTHEFVGSAEVDVFAEFLLDPGLYLLAFPHDALLEILVDPGRQTLLFFRSEEGRGTAVRLSPVS
nr:hypothetical protein [Deinococcus hopiensis]